MAGCPHGAELNLQPELLYGWQRIEMCIEYRWFVYGVAYVRQTSILMDWLHSTYISKVQFGSFLPERDYVTFGYLLSQIRLSVICLSVCLSATLMHPTQVLRRLKLSAIFPHYCLPWPSSDVRAKFYGDRPRGTPPSDALNARRAAKKSDVGHIEGYIL